MRALLFALLFPTFAAACGEPTTSLDPAPVVSSPPDCDAVQVKDGYTRRPCRYPRLHTTGLMDLDVYEPATPPAAGAPVVMFVHGGGWSGGSRHGAEGFLGPWARAGFVGVSIEYELRPPPPLIGTGDPIDSADEMDFQRDAAAAFAWTRQHAGAFGGDPEHVVLMGHSAGGHIVTLLTAQRSWLADALVASGQLDPADAAALHVPSVVAGMINLSGPLDLDLGKRWYGDPLGPVISKMWAPQMRVTGSPLHWLELEQEGPPMLHVVGGGSSILSDPHGMVTAMVDYVNRARSLGIPATLLQPVFQSVHHGFGWPNTQFNGAWCFAMLTHDNTFELLRSASVPLTLNHAYNEERGNVCNLQSTIGGFRVSVPDYAATLQAFARDPGAPVAWVTPRMSHLSIPDATPSPLRINVAGGTLPSAGGAWKADDRPDAAMGPRRVNNRTWNVAGVTDGAGNPVPPGLFHNQAFPFGTGTSMTVRASVPPGMYRVRLYFGEAYGERRVDVEVEGAIRATGVSSWAGAINRAKAFELPAAVAIDAQLDLVLRRTGTTGPGPMLAGVELIPQ